MMSDTTEDLRIGPEILKQQAELYRRLRNTLRWLLGSAGGMATPTPKPGRNSRQMPELERWVLHRLTELDRPQSAHADGNPRLDRRVSPPSTPSAPPTSAPSISTSARTPSTATAPTAPAPPRRPHGAGPPAPLPDHLARPRARLHRRRSLDRPLRPSGRQRTPAGNSPTLPADLARPELLGARKFSRSSARPAACVTAAHRKDARRRQDHRQRRCKPSPSSTDTTGHAGSAGPANDWADALPSSSRSGNPAPPPAPNRAPGDKCAALLARAARSRHRPQRIPALCLRCADAVCRPSARSPAPPHEPSACKAA